MAENDQAYETRLVRGFAALLAAQGFGVYNEAGSDPDARPIFTTFEATVDPSSALWVLYRGTTDMPNGGVEVELQVLSREEPDRGILDAIDFGSAIGNWLNPNGNPRAATTLGSVRVGQIRRTSAGSLGRDENRRPMYTQNYRTRGKRYTV